MYPNLYVYMYCTLIILLVIAQVFTLVSWRHSHSLLYHLRYKQVFIFMQLIMHSSSEFVL